MKIGIVKVYDLEESIIASGLPKQAEYEEDTFFNQSELLKYIRKDALVNNPHFKRACKLAANPAGSGHNNFLSGILVSANVTATNVWWMQFERYHFAQIVSSQSKMHRLREMLKANSDKLPFHEKTAVEIHSPIFSPETLDDEQLAYSCPCGLELTARITTNYLQLKTIYGQRKNHKLKEWRDFCEWIECLPMAAEFITNQDVITA